MLLGTYLSVYSYLLLYSIIGLCCMWEFFKITHHLRDTPKQLYLISRTYSLGLCLWVFIMTYLMSIGEMSLYWIVTYPPLVLVLLIIELFGTSPKSITNIGINLTAQFYIALPMAMLNFAVIIDGKYQGLVMMGFLFLVWVQDSGAYLFGSMFGKNPLFKRISPKKTIEGFLGGAIAAIGVAFAISSVLGVLDLVDWLVLAAITIVFATLGDLIESLFKRNLQIKDSGTFLPGHGGFLDRFDALLFAIPCYAAYIVLIYRQLGG